MENQKCKVCGRELPLSSSRKNYLAPTGHVSTCTDCQNRKRKNNKLHKDTITPPQKVEGGNPLLAQFSPRELIEELKVRGYKGKLQITRDIVL